MKRAETLAALEWMPADVPACCVYCGGKAALSVDHVPPVVAAGLLTSCGRWLYPACLICNRSLGVYPVDCLPDRAAFLVCKLRVRWVYAKLGRSKRYPAYLLERVGKAVSGRLASGAVGAACQCAKCANLHSAGQPG